MEDTALDDEVVGTAEPRSASRRDHQPANVAPKGRKTRVAKARHDTPPAAAAPLNGWGDPFGVEVAPGWVPYWPTSRDLARMSFRPWFPVLGGDRRVISYQGGVLEKDKPIKYREHSLYLMRQEDHDRLVATDPRRVQHGRKKEELYQKAFDSEAGGQRGYVTETVTYV